MAAQCLAIAGTRNTVDGALPVRGTCQQLERAGMLVRRTEWNLVCLFVSRFGVQHCLHPRSTPVADPENEVNRWMVPCQLLLGALHLRLLAFTC